MSAGGKHEVQIHIEPRDDGGLRVWSDDLPELVLSRTDPKLVMADLPAAIEVILAERSKSPAHPREGGDPVLSR